MPSQLIPNRAWPQIDPGKKRHSIAVYLKGTARNSFGEQTTVLGTQVLPAAGDLLMAAIETVTVREVFQDGFNSQVIHKVYIDWTSTRILEGMVVIVHPENGPNANQYEVQDVENVQERNLVMIITCLEIDNMLVGS